MNINHYSGCKKEIQELFFQQKNSNRLQNISMISVCTHTPIIACLFFVGEALDWPQDILDNIKLIVKVYSYKDIQGVPESYPGEKI